MKFQPHIVRAYTPEQVAEIVRFADANVYNQAHDVPAQGIRKTADVRLLQWGRVKQYLEWTQQWVHFANRRDFGLDLYELQDLDLINYNIYTSDRQGEYSWHPDGTTGPSDIKLTMVVNVSTEPYQGGDLELFLNGVQVVEQMRQPGCLVVFPSFVQHRVTPVTQGTRRTISYWVLGPRFR